MLALHLRADIEARLGDGRSVARAVDQRLVVIVVRTGPRRDVDRK